MAEEGENTTPSAEQSSTPAPAASETPAPSSSPSESPASTSGAKESMLDAVLKVVPATNESDVLADQGAKAETTEPPADKPEAETAEAGAEEDDDGEPPADAGNPKLRKQILRLLKQRGELRETVAQFEAMRPAAEIGEQMQAFAQVNNLSGDDVAQVMQLAAMLRHGDYAAFYKAVSPFVRTAQEYLGIALPKDLRDRVAAGHMSEATAKEFARTRMDEQRGRVEVRQQQESLSAQHIRNVQNQVASSVSNYERQLSANDPDYKAKAASVRRTAQAMLLERGGTIASVQDALEITKAAYDEVNATIRRQRPSPAATSRMPNGNGSTMSVTTETKSLMEAAMQGLARARNGSGHP